MSWFCGGLALVMCTRFAAAAFGQQQPPSRCELRGRVTNAYGGAMAHADISITQADEVLRLFSDSSGRFHALVATASATLVVRAMGYGMVQREISGGCGDWDVVMQPAPARLRAVRASTSRASPPSRLMVSAVQAWESQSLNRGRAGPEAAGDIYALAANTPGISAAADGGSGLSVLGLDADQSTVTLDGARLDAEEVPPDAGILARVSTSPWDVSHGGFSGGELALLTPPSGGMAVRKVSASFGTSPATSGSESGAGLVQATKGVLSGSIADAGSYRFSWQAARQTISKGGIQQLVRSGVGDGAIRDSIDSVLAAARRDGLASLNSDAPELRSTLGSAMLRVDAAEWHRTRASLSLLANWRGIGGLFAPGLSVASHAGTDAVRATRAQFGATTDVAGFLNELTVTAGSRAHTGRAVSTMPDVNVRLTDDPFSLDSDIHLGGNAALPRADRLLSLDIRNDISRYWPGERHLARVSLDATRSELRDGSDAGDGGAFVFGSVADFRSASPEIYYWSHAGRQPAARHDGFAVSIGDEWDVTPSVHTIYGIREDVEDVLPLGDPGTFRHQQGSGLSPRAGFTWTPGRSDSREQAGSSGVLVRGGFGRFRGTIPLRTAIRVAGSAPGTPAVELICAGESAPRPDWNALAHGSQPPHACLAGQGAATLLPTPASTRFSDGFAPASAYRAALGASFPAIARIDMDATYSIGTEQRTQIDENLRRVAALVLPDEGNRPVLARLSQIAPSTGIVAAGAGRLDPQSGRRLELLSIARARAAEVMVGVSPQRQHAVGWRISYAYQRATDQQPTLEFIRPDHASAGDDVAYVNEWSRALNEMRQQVVASALIQAAGGVRITLDYTGRSGWPYTPTTAGDVDGDGSNDDPAFIFDPRTTRDTATGRAIQRLLTSAPRGAARCLRRQLGRIARRNSCLGPWSGDASLEVDVSGQRIGLERATHVALYVGNLLAGADMLLHGRSHAALWGSSALPDPVLLRPVGFDTTSRRFRYQVNSGFGEPLPGGSVAAAPFTVSLSLELGIGPDPDRQRLASVLKTIPRDSTQLATRLQLAFGHAGLSAPSLLLKQTAVRLPDSTVAALRLLERAVERQCGSIWSRVAANDARAARRAENGGAGGQPGAASREASFESLLRRTRDARDAEFDLLARAADSARALLSAAELGALPQSVRGLVDRGAVLREKEASGRRGHGG